MPKREKTGLAAAMLRYIGAFVYLASGTFTAQPHTLSGQTNVTQLLHVTGTLSLSHHHFPHHYLLLKRRPNLVYIRTWTYIRPSWKPHTHACIMLQLLLGVGGGGLAMGGYGFKNISILILPVPSHRLSLDSYRRNIAPPRCIVLLQNASRVHFAYL